MVPRPLQKLGGDSKDPLCPQVDSLCCLPATISMGLEFKYALGKVLGTQDRPTLRLASHHCVLILTLLKTIQHSYPNPRTL